MLSKVKAVLSDSDHRHTAINSAIALAIRVLGAGMAFLFNLIIARQLGAEESGYFFLALSLIMFLSSISRLGFDNTVLRFTAARSERDLEIKGILNFSLKYVLPASIAISMLVYFSSSFIGITVFGKPEMASTLRNISPSIIGISVVYLVAMSLQARHKLLSSIPCQSIAHFLICACLIIILNSQLAEEAALSFTLSLLFSSFYFYFYSTQGLRGGSVDVTPISKQILESAVPNSVVLVMSQAALWGVPVIIGIFLVAEQVAFFSVAQRIAFLCSFILMAVNLVVAPKFSAFHAKGDDVGIRKTALFSVRLLVLSALPIVLFMLLFPEYLMGLFGEEFRQGALVLQILVLGQAINVVTGSVGFLLLMCGNERDMRLITVTCGIGMFIFVPVFTKLFGAIGAASTTAAFMGLQNLLAVYFVKKRLGFNTLMFWQKI